MSANQFHEIWSTLTFLSCSQRLPIIPCWFTYHRKGCISCFTADYYVVIFVIINPLLFYREHFAKWNHQPNNHSPLIPCQKSFIDYISVHVPLLSCVPLRSCVCNWSLIHFFEFYPPTFCWKCDKIALWKNLRSMTTWIVLMSTPCIQLKMLTILLPCGSLKFYSDPQIT